MNRNTYQYHNGQVLFHPDNYRNKIYDGMMKVTPWVWKEILKKLSV